jgi:maleylpyruvate isomerase
MTIFGRRDSGLLPLDGWHARPGGEGLIMAIDVDPADPAAAAAELIVAVGSATERLRQTAAGLSDQQAREPSRLPGWSRGHVLTHVARNADSLRNLLIWARTGIVTPQYADQSERERGIAAGAGRPPAELLADLDASAAALAAEAASLRADQWAAEVRGLHGAPHAAWFTLQRRRIEVEVHHVDLDAGYSPDEWPLDFAATLLESVVADFADAEAPAARLRIAETGSPLRIGPPDATTTVEISGPARALLAWLIGRSSGAGLAAAPPGPLPALPPW